MKKRNFLVVVLIVLLLAVGLVLASCASKCGGECGFNEEDCDKTCKFITSTCSNGMCGVDPVE